MKTLAACFARLRLTRFWRSAFRGGPPGTRLRRSLAIRQNVFLHPFGLKVRKRALCFATTWYLGVLTGTAFVILTVSGVLLMVYYHPSVPQAYADIKDLKYVVPYGMFLRNLHRWAGHAMVLLVFAHMGKAFYRGAYHPPREFNWVIGVLLLLITLLLSYTGYLLPWDQLAFWAVTVGSNLVASMPVMGHTIRYLLLGGNQVNAHTLLLFYVWHCVALPILAVTFMVIHFWRIRKDGGLYLPELELESENRMPDTRFENASHSVLKGQ
jgi:cytochrome b6